MKRTILLSLMLVLISTIIKVHYTYGKYIYNGNGTVSDTKTGLVWGEHGSGNYFTISEAQQHIEETINKSGWTDLLKPDFTLKWRLPSGEELWGFKNHIIFYPETYQGNYGHGGHFWTNEVNSSGHPISVIVFDTDSDQVHYYFGHVVPRIKDTVKCQLWIVADKTPIETSPISLLEKKAFQSWQDFWNRVAEILLFI